MQVGFQIFTTESTKYREIDAMLLDVRVALKAGEEEGFEMCDGWDGKKIRTYKEVRDVLSKHNFANPSGEPYWDWTQCKQLVAIAEQVCKPGYSYYDAVCDALQVLTGYKYKLYCITMNGLSEIRKDFDRLSEARVYAFVNADIYANLSVKSDISPYDSVLEESK